METKGSGVKIERLSYKLGFSHWVSVDARGLARGLALLWVEDICLEVKWKNDRCICSEIDGRELEKWQLFGCHGTPYISEKATFWEGTKETILQCNVPWIIIGGFE